MKPPTPKNIYSASERMQSPTGINPAKQEFKDDADINSIMRKFQVTGAIDHVANYQGEYGFASPLNLHESMNIITRANSMFEALPSSLRNKFHNDAKQFLEYVQNPDNYEEAKKLGIALSNEAQAEAQIVIDKAAAAQKVIDDAKATSQTDGTSETSEGE